MRILEFFSLCSVLLCSGECYRELSSRHTSRRHRQHRCVAACNWSSLAERRDRCWWQSSRWCSLIWERAGLRQPPCSYMSQDGGVRSPQVRAEAEYMPRSSRGANPPVSRPEGVIVLETLISGQSLPHWDWEHPETAVTSVCTWAYMSTCLDIHGCLLNPDGKHISLVPARRYIRILH